MSEAHQTALEFNLNSTDSVVSFNLDILGILLQ